MKMKCSVKTTITLGIIGTILFMSGILLGPLVNKQVDKELNRMMPLVRGTKTYNYWIDPPVPIHFQFHFFHVINPDEVIQKGIKPVLEERGPYTYILHDTKENLTHFANYTVSYMERQQFIFQRHLSVGDENDTFTTVNLPLVTAITMISNEYSYIKEMTKLMFEAAKDSDLFITLTVKDLIWGYTDPMLAIVKKIFNMFDIPYDDHFGFFYKLNDTLSNNYTVYTGEDSLEKLSKFTEWNQMTHLPYWKTKQCNMINGTDGNLFHPHIDESEPLYLFFPQVCRSYYVSYQKRGEYKGVKYSRFVMKDEIFNNPSINPENLGFCTEGCLPSGLLNASTCRKGAPVVMSQPHFLGADPSVINSFEGLHPDRSLHETFIDLIPLTGTFVRTQRTTQVNIVIENTTSISQTKNLHRLYFPVMFIKEVAALSDDLAKELKDQLQIPLSVVYYTQYICASLGATLLLLSIVLLVRRYRSLNKNDNNIEEEKRRLLSANKQDK